MKQYFEKPFKSPETWKVLEKRTAIYIANRYCPPHIYVSHIGIIMELKDAVFFN